MDDGSWYLGYNGCVMGGTQPTDIDVIVGTRSTVGHGRYSDYKWFNRGMAGTHSMTVDCWWYKWQWRATRPVLVL